MLRVSTLFSHLFTVNCKKLFHLPTLIHNFYSLTICILHYNPRHVSSINMPIFRRTNLVITASGIVTFCKQLYSMPDESRLLCILYSCLKRVTIPDVITKFVLLKMACWCSKHVEDYTVTYILHTLCIKVGKWNRPILWCTVKKNVKIFQNLSTSHRRRMF